MKMWKMVLISLMMLTSLAVLAEDGDTPDVVDAACSGSASCERRPGGCPDAGAGAGTDTGSGSGAGGTGT